ncbi:MAG TPA: archease [Bacteroidales bacterium]|nr:archease [Bacteroidales bacterium]
MKKYKLIDHTADIGCEIYGGTRKELFANSVVALFELMLGRKTISRTNENPALETKSLTVEGEDLEDLFINFLREVLYLFNGEGWVVVSCQPLQLTTKHIVARLTGEPYISTKHQVKMEIKAVTYHGLRVKKTKTGWVGRVIYDI